MAHFIERSHLTFLRRWLYETDRLPLIIRGARQVGKTALVRHLAKEEKRRLIEINLEYDSSLRSLFADNDPKEVLKKIDEVFGEHVDPTQALLFIDEIQVYPELISKLRWFAERMPELPVIAAGSLLEFALGSIKMSMPVGRIEYMYLEPLSFKEFLAAQHQEGLIRAIERFSWKVPISLSAHEKLSRLFHEYTFVGGMPAAVNKWVNTHSVQEVGRVHRYIMSTYRDDFAKYGEAKSSDLLDKVVESIPTQLGKKFMYRAVDNTAKIPVIKDAITALKEARICHYVYCTAANGIPLSAEVNEKFFKLILLDVGLCSALLHTTLKDFHEVEELAYVNKGDIAEQVTGQILRTTFEETQDPALYYWMRTKKDATAEVDYVITHRATPVPIEVKAGSAGTLKSLHIFMERKGLSSAIRVYSAQPLVTDVQVKAQSKDTKVSYKLYSMPFYLLSEVHRLLDETSKR